MSADQSGRYDQHIPLFGAREKAIALMVAFTVTLVGIWHAAVVMTTNVEWGQLVESVARLGTGKELDAATFVTLGALCLAALFLLYWMVRLKVRLQGRGRSKGLADARTVRDRFGVERAKERSTAGGMPLRPGLKASEKDVNQFGLVAGAELHSGEEIVVPFDDHVSVTAPTGAGKSASVMIPSAQAAPGALVVTTNEATILDAIASSRKPLGRIWVFDPLGRTHWPEPMVWDPVAGCEDGERATARGGAFCMGVQSANARSAGNEAFFADTAKTAMETMLHAAALGGRSISDVLTWALDMGETVAAPRKLIEESGSEFAEPLWARALVGVAEGADDTVASTRTTLQRHIKPLLRRSVLRWVDPKVAQRMVDERRARIDAEGGDSSRITDPVVFDPYAFVQSTDTLVLVSDDNAPSDVSPLCSMVFQEVMDAVKALAPLTEHQRIEPPMRVVGDEIANVAPIPKLPAMTTEVRKLGVQLILAFQDDLQATSRWGEADGMKMLNQMGLEIILPGVKSESTLKRFSAMSGSVDVIQRNDNIDASTGHRQSTGLTTQERVALRPDEIRKMADGTALVVYRNIEPFMMRMIPWWDRKGGKQLSAAAKVEAKARAERGQAAWREQEQARARHLDSTARREEATT